MESSRCVGANANLEQEIPITLNEKEGEISVYCPYFASSRCVSEVSLNDLQATKTEINNHPRSTNSEKFATCIFASSNRIEMV